MPTVVVKCWGCRETHEAIGTGLVLGEKVTCACTCHDTTPILLGPEEVPFTVSMALPMFDRMAKEVLD